MHARTLRSAAAALALVAAVAGVAAGPLPARAADPDPLGAELMRLTNLDRQALGRPALAVDPVLVGLAASTAFGCPSNGAMTIPGRSADMAARDYFAHGIRDCRRSDGSEYNVLDIMDGTFGYNTWRGENIAWNNYPTTMTVTYDTGCAIGASSGCPGAETTTPATVAAAQRGFMNSSGHRSNLLGDYDRFGCGSAQAASGRTFYTCLFSKGGPAATTTTTTTTGAVAATIAAADTTRPRVTRETGRWATFSAGYARRFYATLSDNRGVVRVVAYLDGRRVGAWTKTGVTSVRQSVRIPAWRLTRGRHVLVWKATDAAGNVSTVADGKVVFTIR